MLVGLGMNQLITVVNIKAIYLIVASLYSSFVIVWLLAYRSAHNYLV